MQHGWLHTNHSIKIGKKYEFGTSRPHASQQEDIQLGLKRMLLAFGECFTPAFVPPYHGYDARTLKVLHKEGFKVFSAGERRGEVDQSLIELPAQVAFTRYENNEASIRTARGVMGDVALSVGQRALTGVLTHHADFSSTADRRELKLFFKYVAGLKVKEGWRVLLFSDVLSVKRGKPS